MNKMIVMMGKKKDRFDCFVKETIPKKQVDKLTQQYLNQGYGKEVSAKKAWSKLESEAVETIKTKCKENGLKPYGHPIKDKG